jgi:hypothetical protein
MVLRAECYLRRAARLRVKSNNHFWRLRFKEELNSISLSTYFES